MIGWELEVEIIGQKVLPTVEKARKTQDYSLRYGLEYVSSPFDTVEEASRWLRELEDELIKDEVISYSPRTSFHIHFDKHYLPHCVALSRYWARKYKIEYRLNNLYSRDISFVSSLREKRVVVRNSPPSCPKPRTAELRVHPGLQKDVIRPSLFLEEVYKDLEECHSNTVEEILEKYYPNEDTDMFLVDILCLI